MPLSTRASIRLTGETGRVSLGSSVQSPDPDRFAIVGTGWQFGDVDVVDVELAELDYSPVEGDPLGFPPPGSAAVVFVIDGQVLVRVGSAEFVFGAGSAAVMPDGRMPRASFRGPVRLLFVTCRREKFDPGVLPARMEALSTTAVRIEPALAFLLALVSSVRTRSIRSHPTAEIIVKLLTHLVNADHAPDTLTGEYRLVMAMTLLQPAWVVSIEQVASRSGYASAADLEAAVLRVYGVDASALLSSRENVGTDPTRDDGRPQQRLRFR